jgi:response regulator RpfG family c-di-GMP phosphodiesterase
LDGDKIDESYTYTFDMIRLFFDTFGDLDELSVYKIEDGHSRLIFDCGDDFKKDGVVGQISSLDKGMLSDLEKSGKAAYSTHTRYGYSISSYVPVYDSEGDCVAYVVATVKISLNADYMRRYGMHAILMLSGVFMLVLSYGLWETGHHVVTPIESLEESIDGFMDGIDDQNMLDKSVKELQKLDIRSGDEIERLYKSVCEMAVGTTEQMRNIRFLAKTKDKMQNGIIITMAEMVENRDSDTGAHIKKTAAYVRIILESLRRKGYYTEKLTDKYIAEVEMSAPLHDIGKINISDAILNKHGKLTDEEYAIMKTHTTAGKEILDDAISTIEGESYLKEARNMAAYHHEKWDGTGYPEGLHGQVIPLSARVMAVADVFDALVSPRVYKEAFSFERALEIIKDGSGKHFDPKCVEAFFDALPEIKAVMKKYQENDGGIS